MPRSESHQRWYDKVKNTPEYRAKQQELKRQQYLRLKRQVYEAYGSKCACCGETERAFLCIDHVEGGGNAERSLRGGTLAIFREIRRQGFPPTYQVLCHNCNHAKEFPGGCPHRKES